MEVFASIENHFANIGLTESQSLGANRFNVKNMATLSMLVANIILSVACIFYGASDFDEYVDSIFGCLTLIDTAIAFVYLICQMAMLFRFIVDMKNTIDQREWNQCLNFHFQLQSISQVSTIR